MKNLNSGFSAALGAARNGGIVPRVFVFITAKVRATGAPVSIGLWTGDEDISATVISGITGLPEARSYVGAVNLVVSDISRVSDLTTQTVTVEMSQIADAAQQLVRTYDIRLGKVEIHEMTLDVVSRQLSSNPEIAFLGQVDGAPVETPIVGQDGSLTISVISDAINMLERTNPRKSSYEGQKRRGGDEWGLYSSTIATWQIPWGQKAS
jgi:hypothetical protein